MPSFKNFLVLLTGENDGNSVVTRTGTSSEQRSEGPFACLRRKMTPLYPEDGSKR